MSLSRDMEHDVEESPVDVEAAEREPLNQPEQEIPKQPVYV